MLCIYVNTVRPATLNGTTVFYKVIRLRFRKIFEMNQLFGASSLKSFVRSCVRRGLGGGQTR